MAMQTMIQEDLSTLILIHLCFQRGMEYERNGGVLTPKPSYGIACAPNITVMHATPEREAWHRTDDPAAVTCPHCKRTEVYRKAKVIRLVETVRASNGVPVDACAIKVHLLVKRLGNEYRREGGILQPCDSFTIACDTSTMLPKTGLMRTEEWRAVTCEGCKDTEAFKAAVARPKGKVVT